MHSIRPYPNELFSALSFIGFILSCIPFPLHFRAGRTGTVLYMAWAGLSCLVFFINSVVWNGNVINWAPVWCDISTKFIIGGSSGIPAASLCITHHLYLIAYAGHATFTKREKRNQLIFDLGVGIGIPILQMILHYIVQGHRFNILEDIGCYPHINAVAIAFPIMFYIPFLIGLVSATYGFLTIRTLRRSRRQFSDLVHQSADSNINFSHYFRLMSIAAVDVVGELTVNLYILLMNIFGKPNYPWISWASVHSGFSRVDQFPVIVWRSWGTVIATGFDTTRWIPVACAFLFFGLFGFSQECMDLYCSVFVWLRTIVSFPPPSQPAHAVSTPLPQMDFKTVSPAGSHGSHSSPSRTSVITLPEPALTRSEPMLDLDHSPSVGRQNHSMSFTPQEVPFGMSNTYYLELCVRALAWGL